MIRISLLRPIQMECSQAACFEVGLRDERLSINLSYGL